MLYFQFSLARELHKTLEEIQSLTPEELHLWSVFFKVEADELKSKAPTQRAPAARAAPAPRARRR
jgi:hypothetical protein